MSERDERFWAKVAFGDGCWEWTAALNTHGYGWVQRRGRSMYAQRYAWEQVNGEIPNGMSVLHHCDNRKCVNPKHLYLGTQFDNMRDRADRRRCKTQKLSVSAVQEIRALRAKGWTCQRIADKFGISNGHASSVARRLHYARD